MNRKLFLIITILMWLPVVAQTNNDGLIDPNDYTTLTVVNRSIPRLQSLGYDEAVIENLRAHRIDLLIEIDGITDDLLKPVLLYRGVTVIPEKYDPRYLETHHLNELWRCMTQYADEALQWATGARETPLRIVLEFQYPKYNTIVLFPGQKGMEEFRTDVRKFPDDRIFLRKLGVFDVNNLKTVKWYPYREAFKADGSLNLEKILQ